MNHCVRLLLLFTPSLVALGLLGIAFTTDWWTFSLEQNIPKENSLDKSHDEIIHSTLVGIVRSHSLLSRCVQYQNVKVLVGDHDFRLPYMENDKKKLANENCTDNQLSCQTGAAIGRPLTRCIDYKEKCNRVINCEDKSDETFCAENLQTRDTEFFNCPTNYTKCSDRKSCYRQVEQTCDGIANCLDNSDEKNCNEDKCQRNRRIFCPKEGKCAQRENAQRCDGIADCQDNSDEENCSDCHGDRRLIHCDSKCLPMTYRCDGIVHCSDLRDESNCGNSTIAENLIIKTLPSGQQCVEQRFHPLRFFPPTVNPLSLDAYAYPEKRSEYLNILFYSQLSIAYGIFAGLIFLFFAVISLFFFGCCRRRCISVPFYLYGFWMLLAWLVISAALVSFVFLWLWQKQTILDPEKRLPLEMNIHQRNPTLKDMEFFGLSFWLACGAALATFFGLLLSYCVCCTIGSSRADDKEYEIMQMHTY